MHLARHLLSCILVATAIWLLGATPARAETVQLRSGRTLKVESVRLGERVLNVTIRKDGRTARVDLRFELLDPRGLLRLFDRSTDALDGRSRLRSARLALEFGERGEAALRFQEAARLDPRLASERDAGLGMLRSLEAADALVDLETRLRAGSDPRGSLGLASALLEGPHSEALSAGQKMRIQALGDLAGRLLQREVLRRLQGEAKQAAAAQPGQPPASPAPAPPPGPAPQSSPVVDAAEEPIERVRGLARKAMHAREAAADPKITTRRAIRHLEVAAKALLDGRRLMRTLDMYASDESAQLSDDVRLVLVATYLDLADLYRQEGRFDAARARIRAVLILDPGNEEAWEQRQLIEDDLHREPVPLQDPYARLIGGYGLRVVYPTLFHGYYSPSPYYGLGRYPRAIHYGRGGIFFGSTHFGSGHSQTRHAGGRRR